MTVLVAIMSFVGSFFLFPLIGAEFVPATDQSELQVTIETPVGSTIDYTAIKVHQVEHVLKAMPEVESTYTTINAGSASGENQASIAVSLVKPGQRQRTSAEMAAPVREALRSVLGATFSVSAGGGLGSGSPIQIKLMGEDLEDLSSTAAALAERMREIPGAVDVQVNLQQAQPMFDVVIDRQAASSLGVGIQETGSALRAMLGGETASEWTSENGDRLDVVVRLPEQLRQNVDAISSLPIAQNRASDNALAITLDEIAELQSTFGPSEINRENLTRQVSVSANVGGRVLGAVSADVNAAVAELDMPAGNTLAQGGDTEMMTETMGGIASALLLAVIFIYLVLASQFGSFLQPLAIMTALPLSLVGVMLGLLVGGSTLNMYSMIGFVMLMGLVVKNAILLVDNANQCRREGATLVDALIEAGETRFRPIIMTTLAMIFGMLPLALALHEGSDQNAPMAHAVIGGLISSTLLTLVVVPVMLTYTDALGRFAGRFLPRSPDQVENQHEQPSAT